MKSQILSRLHEIEAEENVRIVYACESGSRAWGFPSADSDYDVRFLYVRPKGQVMEDRANVIKIICLEGG